MIRFITDLEIYEEVITKELPEAKKFLWIGTSDIKDMYVHEGKKMVPLLKVISDKISEGVEVRLIHAKEPGPNFRKDFEKYKNLYDGLERLLCPRVHFKCVIIDGKFAYSGSANITGAGMGAKSEKKRNFESGIVTTDRKIISQIMNQFDEVWMGSHCDDCKRKDFCGDRLLNDY